MPTHRQTRHPLSIPLQIELQPFSPSTMDSSDSLCLDHMVMGDNLSNLLKSFLLKKLLRPLRRLEQPMMSIETLKIAQDKHQLTTNGTHTPIISQVLNILKYNNSLLLPFSAISNQRIKFTEGLFALLPSQDDQTACLQVTNEIHIQSGIPIIQPIFTLYVGHPPIRGNTEAICLPLAIYMASALRSPGKRSSECFHVTSYQQIHAYK